MKRGLGRETVELESTARTPTRTTETLVSAVTRRDVGPETSQGRLTTSLSPLSVSVTY